MHYAWVVAGVTFVVLLVSAGVRATPAVLIVPLEQELGWARATVSLAVALNLTRCGLAGPFAAAAMALRVARAAPRRDAGLAVRGAARASA